MATSNTHLPIKDKIFKSIFEFFWISLWKKKNNEKRVIKNFKTASQITCCKQMKTDTNRHSVRQTILARTRKEVLQTVLGLHPPEA